MGTIRVNKVDAARRQIDGAIRLLFDGFDPVCVLTLAGSGGRILRDLCKRRASPGYQRLMEMVKPGQHQAFWSALNRPINFLKHADRDPDAILENVEEEFIDSLLLIAVGDYADLGNEATHEMECFTKWMACRNPDLLNPDLLTDNDRRLIEAIQKESSIFSRHELFKAGRVMLQMKP